MQKQNLFCWYSLVDETSKFSKIKQCRAAAAGVPRGYRPSPIWIRIESVLFYGISHVSWVETCSFHAKNVAEKCWNKHFRAFKIAKKIISCTACVTTLVILSIWKTYREMLVHYNKIFIIANSIIAKFWLSLNFDITLVVATRWKLSGLATIMVIIIWDFLMVDQIFFDHKWNKAWYMVYKGLPH